MRSHFETYLQLVGDDGVKVNRCMRSHFETYLQPWEIAAGERLGVCGLILKPIYSLLYYSLPTYSVRNIENNGNNAKD